MVKRNAKGQFPPGVSGNPSGRPRTRRNYLSILSETVSDKQWKAIIKRAVTDATAGNDRARKWLSDYLLGKPVERVKAELTQIPMTLAEWRKMASQRRKDTENADNDGGVRHGSEQPVLDDENDHAQSSQDGRLEQA